MNNLNRVTRIDGLRGLAILFVLFFHLDLKYFDGGFIGVDIFFVISGYVISLSLKNNYLNNKLSLKNFYYKRIRRLIPPLLVVNTLVLLAGFFILSPQLYKETSWSSIGSMFSFSNFIFWRESGYFNFDSNFKPLLHTWSLSLEEQFYLLWPLFFIFFLKKLKNKNILIFTFFILIILINIVINSIFSNGFTYFKFLRNIFANGESTIFYLLPFRIFEFAIGSLFVFINYRIKLNSISVLSFFIIILSLLNFDQGSIFPIYTSIFFLFSTTILIINDSKINQIILENKLLILYGKISYSLYLIHWPIIVYWKYLELPFRFFDKVIIFIICTFFSYLMFEFLEKKLKKININIFIKKYLLILIFAIISITLINIYIIKNDGIPKRFFKNNKILYEDKKFIKDNLNNIEIIWKNYSSNSQLFISKGIFDQYVDNFRKNHSNTFDSKKKNLVIIGDSMASDFFNILLKMNLKEEFNLIIFSNGSCRFTYEDLVNCEDNLKIQRKISQINPDKIVISRSWQSAEIMNFKKSIPYFKSLFNNSNTIFVTSKQQSNYGLNLFAKIFKPYDETLKSKKQKLSKQAILANDKLKEVLDNASLLDLTNLFCKNFECNVFDEKKFLLIYDYAHLTPKGVDYFARELQKNSEINNLFNLEK